MLAPDSGVSRRERGVARTAETASSASLSFLSECRPFWGVYSARSTERDRWDCQDDWDQALTVRAVLVDGLRASHSQWLVGAGSVGKYPTQMSFVG